MDSPGLKVSVEVSGQGRFVRVLLEPPAGRLGFYAYRWSQGSAPRFPGPPMGGGIMVSAIGHAEGRMLLAALQDAAQRLERALYAAGGTP